MKRKLFKIIVLLGMLSTILGISAFATAITATPTTSSVVVNGTSVKFQAYTINKNNYFKLRDLAEALNGTGKQFNVTWNQSKQVITIIPDTAYASEGEELEVSGSTSSKTAVLNSSPIYLNSTKVSLTAYTIDKNNYFKLRDVAAKLNFGVDYTQSTNTISIDTTKSYIETSTTSTQNTTYEGQGIGTAVALDNMKIRDASSTSGKSYRVIPKGTSVEVLEQMSNGWLKIVWIQASVGYAYTSNYKGTYYTVTLKDATPSGNDDPSSNDEVKILLDAGHGGTDPGALLEDSGGNIIYRECDLALDITKKLGVLLEKNGITVSYTRTTDTYPTLPERVEQANNENVDYFVCIHLNSATVSASGIETLIAGAGGEAEKLANAVQAQLVSDTGAVNRGIKERPNLYVLKNTNMPAILVETGFISNLEEADKLASDTYQETVAEAIAKGICSYLGKSYVS